MKKILFVINTMGTAGAEKALLELMRILTPPEYEVSLYVILGRGELMSQIPSHVNILNKHFNCRSVFSVGGRISMGAKCVAALLKKGWIFKNSKYIKQNYRDMKKRGFIQWEKLFWRALADSAPVFNTQFDLAVAYIEGAATYYVANRANAKKRASFVHIDYQAAGYTRYMDNGCFEKIDRVFAVANNAIEKFLGVYPELSDKVFLFRNIINREYINERAKEQGGFIDDYKGTRLLTVGRLHPQKAYDIAIQAMSILKERGVNVRWYVLGEGAERANLEKLISEKHVEDCFILLGYTENPYVYLKQCDIYVHESRFEGKSIAIEEAQVLCKPIIASDFVSNKEQINSEVDGLLTVLEPKAIADAIQMLSENNELKESFIKETSKKRLSFEEDLMRFTELMNEKGIMKS